MRKGQAAMEFLLTYGWAILAALVVIGALAYFGVLNPQRLVPTRCDLQGGNIKCVDKLIDQANNRVQLRLQNAVGNSIQISALSVRSLEPGVLECTPLQGAATCNGLAMGAVQVLAGDSINCLAPCALSPALKKGSRVRANITLGYTDLSTTFPHTVVGELISDVE